MSYTNILKLVLIVSASYICFCEGYMLALCPFADDYGCDCSNAICPSRYHCYETPHGPGCARNYEPITQAATTVTTVGATPVDADVVHFVQITMSIYSGNQDPVFNIFYSNGNFTSIVKTAKAHASTQLAGMLGYRGFLITLYSHAGSRTVTLGKCTDPSFEEMLLQTVAKLTDTKGARMVSSIEQQVQNTIQTCHS